MRKLKVGLFLSDELISNSISNFISDLLDLSNIELVLIYVEVKRGKYLPGERSFNKCVNRIIKIILFNAFKCQFNLERIISGRKPGNSDFHKPKIQLKDVAGCEILSFRGTSSLKNRNIEFTNEDLVRLKKLSIDVSVNINVDGIIHNGVLEYFRYGILSIYHNEVVEYSKFLYGFWHVFNRIPTIMFGIVLRTSQTHEEGCVFRGVVPTHNLQYSNSVQLNKECFDWLRRTLDQFYHKGELFFPQSQDHSFVNLKIPNVRELFVYQFKIVTRISVSKIKRNVFRIRNRWNVAYLKEDYNFTDLAGKGTIIKNPKYGYYADPFVIKYKSRSVLFVEEYCYKTEKGAISAIEIVDNDYVLLGKVIEEPFHVSYPFVFEYNSELYMVPESKHAKSVRLYKCLEFPLQWRYEYDLISEIRTVDTSIFKHDKKWWLLTNKNSIGNFSFQLHCYFADNPISRNWKEHPDNPIVYDGNGRNGGIITRYGHDTVRVSQNFGFNTYGKSLTFSKITELSETCYKENEVFRVFPDENAGIVGIHHLHSNGEYTVYDYAKEKRIK